MMEGRGGEVEDRVDVRSDGRRRGVVKERNIAHDSHLLPSSPLCPSSPSLPSSPPKTKREVHLSPAGEERVAAVM